MCNIIYSTVLYYIIPYSIRFLLLHLMAHERRGRQYTRRKRERERSKIVTARPGDRTTYHCCDTQI